MDICTSVMCVLYVCMYVCVYVCVCVSMCECLGTWN